MSKSLTTGHAAHIHAAAQNGPRYDAHQTPAERKAITNGLWLCRECGDIVDKDDAPHPPELLRQWKRNHEAMIAEVRTQGYASSLDLIQSRRLEPAIAKRIVSLIEDRRVFWASFDAEFPERVRHSLDNLRAQLADIRGGVSDSSGMDQVLLSLMKTILHFFDEVEHMNLQTLRCDSRDPEWRAFRDALAALRKSVGLQVSNIASAYGIRLSEDLSHFTPANRL